eukprot:c29096_g2_i3 orf=615-3137(+)
MSVLSNRLNNMEYHYLQRAKVYRLNDEGKWDDKGTGHVLVDYLERSDAVGLVVIDEEDNATLLVHRISADDIYRRQEDTIISWTDPEAATDLALSFQEAMGCSYIWDQICNVQRNIHFPSVGAIDVGPRSTNEDLEHSGTSQGADDTHPDGVGNDALELPVVEISTLPQIVKIVTEVSPSFLDDRDRVASVIFRDPNFLRKLVDLFRVCEDLENIDGLHMLHKIVKGIISLNDGRIFDIIFSDNYIMDIVGALEYDPELPLRQDHRNFLCKHVLFKEAVHIEDPGILSKIHQTYRIGYIKDVILPRVLDDQTFGTINAMILANNVAVISALQDDTNFIRDLFARLRSPSLSEQTKKDLVRFIQEFCTLSKSLQLANRIHLFSSLVKEGLFDIVTDALQSSDDSLHFLSTDILIVVLNHDPGIVRKFLVHQEGQTLFGLLVKGMLLPGEGGLQAQLLEIMRMLLHCDSAERVEKSPFLDMFYQKYMDEITEILSNVCPGKGNSDQSREIGLNHEQLQRESYITPEVLGNICELLCFCMQNHSYRIKYHVLSNNVIEKVLRLTRRKEKYLVVAAVRFLRTCIGRKDEFYNQYIVKNDLLEPVIQVFLANGSRYNLLNSAVLELFDFIRTEGVKKLIVYIVEKYYDKLEKVDYVDTFRQLKLKHEQILDGDATGAHDNTAATVRGKDLCSVRVRERLNEESASPDPRKRKDERALDKDEEDYFNEDSDDEEDTASAKPPVPSAQPAQAVILNGSALGFEPLRGGPFGLVDYEDEDDDPPVVPGCPAKETPEESSDNSVFSSGTKGSGWPNTIEETGMQKTKQQHLSQGDSKKDETERIKRRKV